jgi:hypothetical protein
MKKSINAKLINSEFFQNKSGKVSLLLGFKQDFKDGSFLHHLRYIPIKGGMVLPDIVLEELKILGLKEETQLIDLHGQGEKNNSKILHFGKVFELELEEYLDKWHVNRIREVDGLINRSSISQETLKELLADVCIKELNYE